MKAISLRSLAAVVLLTASVSSQGILPYLPKGTMMAMSAPDLTRSMAKFEQMPLAKMWAENEVQTFVADLKTMAMAQLDAGMAQMRQMHEQGAMPVDPDELMKLRLNGGTFAITQLGMAGGDSDPMPKVGLVLHLDFGDSAPAWNGLMQMGLGMLEAQAGDGITKSERMIGDVKMLTLAPKDPPGLEMALNIAMVPNGVLIGSLESDVSTIVENMQAKKVSLAADPGYQAATKSLNPSGAECEMFMAPDTLVGFALSALRVATKQNARLRMIDVDGVERALQAMGMRNLGTMGMTSSYVDGKSITRSFQADPKGGTASTKTIDTSFLKWVPKDAVSFSASTLDMASIYDRLLKGLMAYDEEFGQQMLARLAKLEGQLGFTLRGDLFGSLGDHVISWSMPMGTISSAPEMAVLVKVENQEKLVGALQNLAALTNGMIEIEEGKKRGLTAYQVHINFDPSQGMGGMNPFDMFQPTFAFKNGYMVAGFSASDIKRVFQRMDREDDPKGDIRSNKEFAAVATSIPQGVDSLAFTDWKAQFESFYQLATGLLAFVPMPEDVPIDMSLLPDSATLTKHLFASLSYSKTDANGSESVSVSPFGPEVWMAFGALLGVGGAAAVVGIDRGGF